MIIEAIVQIFTNIVTGFQSLFPLTVPGQTDSKMYEAIEWLFGNLHKGDTFLPTDTLMMVLGTMLAFEVIFLLFDLGIFIYKRLRG